jgi:hypothetical protein
LGLLGRVKQSCTEEDEMPALNGNVRDHGVRDLRMEIRGLAGEGIAADEVARRRSSTRILLGQRVARGVDDSRALAASVLFRMPPELRDTAVREFLGWVQGSHGPLVSEYMRAATIRPEVSLGELSSFQRAALIGELRFRRRLAP